MIATGSSERLGTTMRSAATAWRQALAVLGGAALLWGLLFREEIAAAIGVWRASTAYGHCFLVLPVAGWLAWQRRERVRCLAPAPSPALACLALLPALAWLAAERLGVMEGRQLAAIGVLWVVALATMGPAVARAMAAPLGYLVFLVPFGAFAVPPLQWLTAAMIEVGLTAMGTPFHADGLLIETPAGTFHVAEACAGLRFLTASLAFGTLYALEMFSSPGRRLTVLALSVVVPVLANGVRAFAVVAIGQYLGTAEAAAADHLLYGWGFFAAIIALLVLAGMPFREAPVAAPHPVVTGNAPSTMQPGSFAAAAFVALLGPALAQAEAGSLRGAAAAPGVLPVTLAAPAGCEQTATGLACGDADVTGRLLVFSPRSTWSAVAAERRRATGSDDLGLTFALPTQSDGATWQVRSDHARHAWVATASWLGGAATEGGLGSRMRQGWNSVAGGGGRPVLGILELRGATDLSPARTRALLGAVLAAQQPGIGVRAAPLSAGRD